MNYDYHPDITIEINLLGTWTDVSADVLYPIHYEEGMYDASPLSRVADVGYIVFNLDNGARNSAGTQGYYTPGGASVRGGFYAGAEVRLKFTFEGQTFIRFYGRILPDGIEVLPGKFDKNITRVTAADWMEQAENHELQISGYSLSANKTAAEIVELVVADMPIAPQETNYLTCQDTFLYAFDTLRDKDKAIREINKAVISELGYCYLTHSGSGEVLTVEGRGLRSDTAGTSIPVVAEDADFFLLESGDNLLLETGDALLLNQVSAAVFDDVFVRMSAPVYGDDIYNHVNTRSYPRYYDSNGSRLYTLWDTFLIGGGETISNYKARYTSTDDYRSIVGIAPTLLVEASSDNTYGSTDASSDISTLSSLAYLDHYNISLENTSTDARYITKIIINGKTIYVRDVVDRLAADSDSVALYGTQPITIDMAYQYDPSVGDNYANELLARYKDAKLRPSPPILCANNTGNNMYSFLSLEIGDAIEFSESVTELSGVHYIHGRRVEIIENNVIYWQPVLLPATDYI